MTHKELKALIKLMKAQGVTHLKSGDLELTVAIQPPAAETAAPPQGPKPSIAFGPVSSIGPIPGPAISEQDLLFWSAPNLEPQPDETES